MKRLVVFFALLFATTPALAHFGMLIPDTPEVHEDNTALGLTMRFWHPRTNEGMNMAKPEKFGVYFSAKDHDLTPFLQPIQENGFAIWRAKYEIVQPGDYIFYVSLAPYWEETEKTHIIHHVKVIVNSWDQQDSWDVSLGLPLEIIPLTRPYGLYAGNVFTGQVLLKGQPLGHTKLEIEYYDPTQTKIPISESLATQIVKTDEKGYFTFAFPWAGWWGMTALTDGDSVTVDGKQGALEVGGALWLYVSETR